MSKTQANIKIQLFCDSEGLAAAAAELIINRANQAISQNGRFAIALAGGSTPQRTYQLLAQDPHRSKVHWQNVHFFWSDERMVSPESRSSNFKLAQESLLQHLDLPAENIHRMCGECSPVDAEQDYTAQLRSFFADEYPKFDLMLLGMGTDGHTASLFPGSPVLKESQKTVAANFVKNMNSWRLTLTFPALANAREILFLVQGPEKAEILKQVMESEDHEASNLPTSQLLNQTEAPVNFFVDNDAAALLTNKI